MSRDPTDPMRGPATLNAAGRGMGLDTKREQIVALYPNDTCAHLARDALIAAGVPRGTVHVLDRHDVVPVSGTASAEERRRSFWAALASMFTPAESASAYNLVADHDHAVVVLTPDAHTDRERAMQILKSTSPVGCTPMISQLHPSR